MSRQYMSGGTKNGDSSGICAQILVPRKAFSITADQARDAFRQSIVPGEFGRVYYVEVDEEGNCAVDQMHISRG